MRELGIKKSKVELEGSISQHPRTRNQEEDTHLKFFRLTPEKLPFHPIGKACLPTIYFHGRKLAPKRLKLAHVGRIPVLKDRFDKFWDANPLPVVGNKGLIIPLQTRKLTNLYQVKKVTNMSF